MLRRPPLAAHMNGSETMRREARVLGALAGTDVPHPAADRRLPRRGRAGRGLLPDGAGRGLQRDGRACRRCTRATRPCAARWGSRWRTGSPPWARSTTWPWASPTSAARRGSWSARWAAGRSSSPATPSYEGWAGPGEIEGVEEVGAWLEAHRPASFKPGIIHGDYHLANVLYRFDSPDLAAIVDWELTTIGDPLLDLGWLMATWPERDGAEAGTVSVKPWDGFPTAAELVDRYAGRTERDLSAIHWYARAGLLQARHHPGGHPRPRRRRQGRGRDGSRPAQPDAGAVPPRDEVDRMSSRRPGHRAQRDGGRRRRRGASCWR